jgi:hypothetical protein
MKLADKSNIKPVEYIKLYSDGNPKPGIQIVTITIFLFIFRMSIPFFKYPFLILYFVILVNALISYRKLARHTLRHFFSEFYLVLALLILLILSFILSNKLYLIEFKDIVNSLVLISLFYILTILISDKDRLKIFTDFIILLLPLFALIISLVGLLFFFDILTYSDFLLNNCITDKTVNDLDLTDYNFALLPVFFGFISILLLMENVKKTLPKIVLSLILLVFMLQILSSGSRRGLFIFVLILILLAISQVFVKGTVLRLIAKESLIFFCLLVFLFISGYYLITKTPYNYKNKFLEVIGSKNILITKTKIAKQIWRYTSSFENGYSFEKIYNTLWSPVFNPYDPDSGWGSRIHKTVYPLKGKNSNAIPTGSKGYLMDRTCNASYYEHINLSESYSLLSVIDSKKGDSIYSSVFCYVSKEFDGDAVQLSVSSFVMNKNLISGNLTSSYDISRKGEWQKLYINFKSDVGSIPIFMSFTKAGVKDFTGLKGEVIFAYPQYERFFADIKNTPTSIIHSLPAIKESEQDLSFEHNYFFSGSNFFYLFKTFVSGQKERDPLRSLVSKIISEDTTYQACKNKMILETNWRRYGDDRLVRWIFALQIFSKEYTLKHKLFGGGFNFLNWYGYYFLKDKTASDWPHNPFLSILLYSGIFGLLIFCFFLFKVFIYYIKYLREYPLLFIFFLITFFFSFFSGGSPFDPPVMGFFSILPFFIHAVHKKDKEHSDKKISNKME